MKKNWELTRGHGDHEYSRSFHRASPMTKIVLMALVMIMTSSGLSTLI